MRNLFTRGHSTAKTVKRTDETPDIESILLYLDPARLCAFKTAGCGEVCLRYAGRMDMKNSRSARDRRTDAFMQDRPAFVARCQAEIENLVRRAGRKGALPVVRLNGTSDVDWFAIAPELFRDDVTYYDYTKSPYILEKYINGKLPENYHITYSYAETPSARARSMLAVKAGVNLSVVFRDEFPETFMGRPVIDGDTHDFRFLDPAGVVVGLRAKGRAKKDTTGFVQDAYPFTV